jgi:cell division septation protein DedD
MGMTRFWVGLIGLAGGLVALSVMVTNAVRIQQQVNALEAQLYAITDSIADLQQERRSAAQDLAAVTGGLVSRVDGLTASIAGLETRLAQMRRQTGESAAPSGDAYPPLSPPEAAGSAESGENRSAIAVPAVAAVPGSVAAGEPDSPSQGVPRAAPAGPSAAGEWVINLVSLQDKQAADRLMARAHSLGFLVEQVPIATAKEPLWRLRVAGFATSTSAKRYGEELKQALNLTTVWVSKR